jgi:hypothetical protein
MIVDAHTDVLLELVVQAGTKPSSELVLRRGESGVFSRYWLPRLIAGGVGVQICPLTARAHAAPTLVNGRSPK